MFPLPDELPGLLDAAGFSRVDYRRFTNGIAVAHLAGQVKGREFWKRASPKRRAAPRVSRGMSAACAGRR